MLVAGKFALFVFCWFCVVGFGGMVLVHLLRHVICNKDLKGFKVRKIKIILNVNNNFCGLSFDSRVIRLLVLLYLCLWFVY